LRVPRGTGTRPRTRRTLISTGDRAEFFETCSLVGETNARTVRDCCRSALGVLSNVFGFIASVGPF
jgi:hypothetical protein